MSPPRYQTRRIFRSHVTSQDIVRELLQIICLAELIKPSKEVWLVSPWISDFVLLDNRSGRFDAINPQWQRREVRFVDYAQQLMINGTRVVIVTRPVSHNRPFLERIEDRAQESGLSNFLKLFRRDRLHTKGILTEGGLLQGSMNLTYNGLKLNEESIYYETSSEAIAKARIEFEIFRSE
ncbi:phospholipase D-like domain-containing protein DpdK [Magnetococcales bacterium HHB-1]